MSLESLHIEFNNKGNLNINEIQQTSTEIINSIQMMRKTCLLPMKDLVKSMEMMTKVNTLPIQEWAKSMEIMRNTYSLSMKELAKSMEMMTKVNTSPIQEWAKSVEIMKNTCSLPMKELAKSMEMTTKVYTLPIQELANSMKELTPVSRTLQEVLNEIPKLVSLYNESIASYKDVNDDNYLRPVNCEEVIQYVNEVDDIFQDNSLSVIERFYKILLKIYRVYENIEMYFSGRPIMFFIITTIILPTMITQLEELNENSLKTFVSISKSITENYSTDNQLVNKNIKKDISKELNNTKEADKKYLLNTYRFVNCDSLNVRVSNSIKSRSIYKLNRGSVVKIINKQKNWTKIEYKNEDETVIIKGWVFTRYINRFD